MGEQTIPDQTGRTWLVTGATNGVGREVARAAARAGARLIVPARDESRGREVVDELTRMGAEARRLQLDLADLGSVRACAEAITEDIDVLVNNAGAVTPKRRETSDGFELMLGTNFLGPFALTNLLAPRLRERVVIVGSDVHKSGRIDGADPHFRHRRWSIPAAYGQSKLADLLWARALQRRFEEQNRSVRVTTAHPGWALTNLQNATNSQRLNRLVTRVCSFLAQSAEDGARPVLEAAVGDYDVLSYLGPDGFGSLRGEPTLLQPSALARDDDAAEAVWQLGVRETGIDLRPQ